MYKGSEAIAIFGSAVLALVATSARAADTVLFSCATKNGKLIELVDAGTTINYSYGKPGQPEIAISVPRASGSTFQWSGMGRSMNYEVDVPNGDTVYTVYSSFDKIEQSQMAGVLVTVKGKQVADVRCGDTARMTDNLEGVSLKPRDE